jgi:hypothetical protein
VVVHRPSVNLEDIRRQAREEWLAMRAERMAQERAPPADKPAKKSPGIKTDSMTLEERRQQAAERWLKNQQSPKDQPDQAKDLDQEKEIDRRKDLGHGIDDDFGF